MWLPPGSAAKQGKFAAFHRAMFDQEQAQFRTQGGERKRGKSAGEAAADDHKVTVDGIHEPLIGIGGRGR